MATPTLKERVLGRTEVIDPAKGGELALVEDKMAEDGWAKWLDSYENYFTPALGEHLDVRQFMMAALTAVHTNKSLAACDPNSLLIALMQCAHFGLDPDGTQAAIVPFGKTATFVPMYQGYIELMLAAGQVENVVFAAIHEHDEWEHNLGRPFPDDFTHKPDYLGRHFGERGPILLQYAFAWTRGPHGHIGRSQIIMHSREDALEIRDRYSKSYERAEQKRADEPQRFAQHPDWGIYNSPWHTNFDAMWAKGPVRRLARRVSTSPRLRELIRYDVAVDSKNDIPVPQMVRLPEPTAKSIAVDGLRPELERGPNGSVTDEERRTWLLQEIDFMAVERDVDPVAAREAVAQKLETPLDEADPQQIFEVIAPLRADVIAKFEERGDSELAGHYREAADREVIAPLNVLLCIPEKHAFTASDEDEAMCGAEGCGHYEDDYLIHGGPKR